MRIAFGLKARLRVGEHLRLDRNGQGLEHGLEVAADRVERERQLPAD